MPDIDPIMRQATIEWPQDETDEVVALIRDSELNISMNFIQEIRPKFSFVQDSGKSGYTSVITKNDLARFAAAENPESSETDVSGRFFDEVVGHFRQTAEADDYLLFDQSEARSAVGLKLHSALDLLRRLKQDETKEAVVAPAVKVDSAGKGSIDLFESYSQMVFPRVDMRLATRELDLAKLDKMLARSANRRQVWAWAGAKAVGQAFLSDDVRRETNNPNLSGYLQPLQVLGLLDRKPTGPRGYTGQQPLTYPHWPLIKLFDHRWPQLNQLLAEHQA